jgi:membrane-bound metal-dependent hydrolase YbcI (DUF457 family)
MMGKTHRAGGCLAMLLAFNAMKSHGWLVDDINPLVQLCVMYPAASWGSIFPDVDQSAETIPEKTPFMVLFNKILHLGEVRHRSWQTHSLLLTSLFVGLMTLALHFVTIYGFFDLSETSLTILKLMLMGFTVGIASHLILDMFTFQGVRLGVKKWIRLVPHKDAFKTNTPYEKGVRIVLYLAIIAVIGYDIYGYFM